MKTAKYILIGLICAGAVTGCTSKTETEKSTITVTIEPLRYFAEGVAGEKWNVVSMVPDGISPETYDPSPLQLVKLNKSSLYLKIGYIGFELNNMDKLKKNTPGLDIVDTSAGIDLITCSHHHHTKGNTTHVHEIEPHVWTSARNANIILENICKALCAKDKTNETYYRHRCDSMKTKVMQTDSIMRQHLKGAQKTFLIYHPALTYMARDYGLKQLSIEKDGKEPTPSSIKELITQCRKEGVKTIFVQREFNITNAQIIAEETEAELVAINPLSYNWHKEMIHIAQALNEN